MERYDVAYYQPKARTHRTHTHTHRSTRKTRTKEEEKERGAKVRQCAAIVI